jgi:uncharacterized protein YbjT (DUF2867 family)
VTILVTGATGNVGRHVVEQLAKRGADVRALARDPSKVTFPAGVSVIQGDLLDIDSLRNAMSGASTLFLLNGVVADEFTQALVALNIARQAGIDRVVYLSVIHSDVYVNVPHFAGKFGVERMIEAMGVHATILRPAYFIQNDIGIKDVITGYRVYPMPIGNKGPAMIDVSDIGEIAAIELLRREQAPQPLPTTRLNLSDRKPSRVTMSPQSGRTFWDAQSPMAVTMSKPSKRTCTPSCRAGWPTTCA